MTQAPNINTLHGNGRILIVEDVEAVRSLAQRIVSDLGYQVQVAHGGFEALKLLDEGNVFDVLFTDIMMPEMDGEALAKIDSRPSRSTGWRWARMRRCGGRAEKASCGGCLRAP